MGLDPAPFRHLYGLPEHELAARRIVRFVADERPGFPDRVELRDAEPGQSLLLLNYVHQPADTPYRASHAIFIREGAERAFDAIDEVPEVFQTRPISLRGFDRNHQMIDADLADGAGIEPVIERLLSNQDIVYLHAHYAKRGCYAARIERPWR
jgi:hypothetical protein